MSNSCVFCPKAKNRKTGEEGPSKLFMGLLDYSSNNRQFAKENYVLGTSREFREQFGDQVEYNDLDEPTVDSFLKLVDREYSKEKRINSLNRQLGSGTFSYTEADSRRQSFEQQADNDVNANYTTVMTPGENHQCKVEVGENNQANRQVTRDTLASKNLFDRIKAAVQALGGDITFIDERFSRYTTENAQKLANGLHAVIQLAKGGNLTADLAHEAGHFAVGALGADNKLVKRLENSLSEEVMEQLFGDDFDTIRFSENPLREAMGALVGRYIADEVDRKSGFVKLLDRIVNSAKRMFYKLSGDTVGRMRLDAREAAEQVASNFMSQKNAGNIENAIGTKETLFNVVDDGATKIFKDILKNMSLMAKQVGAFDKSMEKEINSIIADVAKGKIMPSGNILQAAMSASGILDAIDELSSMVPTIQGLLDNVSYDMMHLTQSATNLRTVSTFVRQLDAILSLTNDLLTNSNISGIDQYEIPIRKIRNSLKVVKEDLTDHLRAKEKRLFLAFLREAYGKDYIERAGRMVFKKGRVKYQEGTTIRLDESFLESTDHAGDWIEWLTSASNSSDLVNQIVYKATQAYTTLANQNTMRALEDLRELRAFCDRNNVDTEHLFERYTRDIYAEDENGQRQLIHRKGEITGNYVTELDWGSWEEEYRAFRQSLRRDFDALDPGNKTMLKQVYDFKLAEYSKKRINAWHKEHSHYNTKLGQYEPLGYQEPGHPNAGAYFNEDYGNVLSDTERQAAQRFLDIKQEHDSFLTQRTRRQGEAFAVFVSPVRMPQFRGRINDETKTIAEESHKFLPKAYASVLKKRLVAVFTHQANDKDYGNENTNQTINDDVFSKDYRNDIGDVRRVATYGINKFSDMNELTHDLFAGMLQYSAMANTYNVQYQLSNILEVGSDVLSERKVESTIKEKDRKKHSWIYTRYEDFLNSQIYNLYNNRKNDILGERFAVDKAVGTLNSVMSKFYLAGNVGGAIVNTGTGMVEIFKEAVAGSLYTVKDMRWADRRFIRYMPSFWLKQAGKEDKTDKMSLFLQMFDAGNRFDEKVRGYSTKATIAWNLNPFGHNAMVLYSSGDYYMQAVSYLAASRHVKIKLKDGTTCSLWDALETGVKDPNNPDSPIILKYKDTVETREVNGMTMHVYVDKDGQERVWEIDGESEYQDACRETNNRMHGVYNRLDKSMFHSMLVGKMVTGMKGYIFGYLSRKFMSERYSVALGRESEGEWVTFLKTFIGMFTGDYGFGRGLETFLASTLLPIGKRQERFIRASGYSVEQYRNMKRTWFTNAFILVSSLIVWATSRMVGLGGDDDDDDEFKYTAEEKKALRKQYKELGYDPQTIAYLLGEEKAYERKQVKQQYKDLGYSDEVIDVLMDGYDESLKSNKKDHAMLGLVGYYLMGRLCAEQAAYATFSGMELERRAALDFTPLGANAFIEAYKFCNDMLSQDAVEKGSYKGMLKWQKDIVSKTPYIRSWPLLDDPYEAYDNWEFGRRVGR